MELSLEQVADAVMALRVDLRDRPDLERRQLPRFPVWAPRTFVPTGDGWGAAAGGSTPFEGWLLDIACGGVGFLSKVQLVTGQEFYVSIPATESSEIHALCRIVHVRRAQNGSYTGGAMFVKQVDAIPGLEMAPHCTVPGSMPRSA
jgi:hypothetical protein